MGGPGGVEWADTLHIQSGSMLSRENQNRKSKMKAFLGSLYMYMLILCDIEGVRTEPKPPSIFVSVLIRHEVKISLL